MAKSPLEAELLDNAPLRYAPTNELGVVFLFSHLSRRMQLHVVSVQAGFPDCIAVQRVGGKERRIRIEFEFRSSSYRAHGHPLDGCDWIVCWEHDWPGVPPGLKVVELRRYFARGFNVWLVVGPPQDNDWPARGKMAFGKRVAKGDLVLFYEGWPNQWIRRIYSVADEGSTFKGQTRDDVKERLFHGHIVRRVCTLDPPLSMKAVTSDPLLSGSSLFAGTFNRKITEHWWRLYELIVRRYPGCSDALAAFSPSRV